MTEQMIEGPWRATRLWNSIVRSLQDGVPLRKHRRNMRTYENCFTGAEVIEWLHRHLRKNPNFDGEVTKEQTIRLLQKLIKAGVIELVHQSVSSLVSSKTLPLKGSPSMDTTLSAGEAIAGNLYKLANPETLGLYTPKKQPGQNRQRPPDSTFLRSPLAEVQPQNLTATPRQGFRQSFRRTKNKYKSLMLQVDTDKSGDECEDTQDGQDGGGVNNLTIKERQSMNLSYLQSLPPNSLVVLDDNDQTWKDVFISQLKANLSEAHVKGLNLNLSYIIYNMTNVSSRGVVQLSSDKVNDLPRWCLSAMKCLANWPITTLNGEESHFPNYRGFEMDVFSVVRDYFIGLRVPLVTYELFDIFVSAFIKAEVVGTRPPRRIMPPQTSFRSQYAETDLDSVFTSTPSFNRPEFYTMRDDDLYLLSNRERLAKVRHTMDVVPPSQSSLSSTGMSQTSVRTGSAALSPNMSATAIMRNFLPPNTCFETAFMNENPVTRIVPQKRSETLLLQRCGRPLCYTPISSGGSIRSSQWDTRSIATQTSQDEDESVAPPSATRTRQPRWKRTTRFRKSIAIMETNLDDKSKPNQFVQPSSYSTSALPPNPLRGFSSLDNLLSGTEETTEEAKLLRRFQYLSQDETSDCETHDRRSFSGRLELLSPTSVGTLPPPEKKRSPDNIILSKTVRKEKRKQRHKRERSAEHMSSTTDVSPTSTRSTSSYLSQQQYFGPYTTTHYRDLTVKTPFYVDPSCVLRDDKMQYARAEPYHPTLARREVQAPIVAMSQEGVQSAIDSFKLLGLLIPPASRRKLQLLLKFMRRVATKDNKLQLDSSHRQCREVVLDTFSEAILKPHDLSNYDEELCRKIVLFFIEHYDSIWTPPVSLRREVEDRVYQSLVSKRLEAGEDPYPITFCKRVPSKVYEREKTTGAETALADLLDHIVFDVKMSQRDKKKKLIKFRDAYPDIWKQKFPTSEDEPEYIHGSAKKNQTRERFPSLTRLKNAMRI